MQQKSKIKLLMGAAIAFSCGAVILFILSLFHKQIGGLPFSTDHFITRSLLGGLVVVLFFLRESRLKREIQTRIRTEEKLVESEERQRTIIESLGFGIMVMDPTKHEIVQANPEAARMVGLPSNDMIGQPCHRYFCAIEERSCPLSDLDPAINQPERILLTAKGSEKPILKSVMAIQLDGREHHLVGFIDNSKSKFAEDKLLKTVERFKSLTNSLNVGFFRSTVGPEGRFIEINESTRDMFGYESKEAFMTTPVSALFQDPSHRKLLYDQILEHGVIKNEIIRFKKKDGSLLIGSLSTALVKTEHGETPYIDGILEDVTERELISEKLRKSEKRYEELFNSITDLVYTQDLSGRFTSANNALHQLFGYELNEFLGRETTKFMKPEHAANFKSKYLDQIKKNGSHEGVSSYIKKDGGKIYLEYRSAMVQPEEGEPYISGIARDVTERIVAERKIKALQNQMLQVQKMEAIGTLAGGIAHDFNNILSAVIGYTELALFDVEEGSSLHRSLTEVLKAGRRASDLVKQILTFSRQSKHEAKAVHLNPLVKEALKMLRSTIPTSIEITENIHSSLLTIRAEPTHVHQIVVNLVANAAQAMGEEVGNIEISLAPLVIQPETSEASTGLAAGDYARLTIKDNGQGIADKDIDHIFEPYFTTKEQHKGTGLGLAVVHGIVETYNGHIRVSSKIDHGTTFEIYLPVDLTAGVDLSNRWTGPLPVGNERILFVDDEPMIVDIQKQSLKLLGYNVTGCTSSTDALEAFKDDPDRFNLVITDMTMPHMSGITLARNLKSVRPDIPIILCTGFSENLNDPHASKSEFDGFLLKPVDKAKMAVTIRKVLKAAGSKLELAASA